PIGWGAGSVVVGYQGRLVLDAELPVEQDRGGQREQSLADADNDPAQGSATMLFQPELVFEGVDDRLDPLAHPTQRPEPIRLVLAVWADEVGRQRSEVLFEGSTSESLVGQDGRARGRGLLVGRVVEVGLGDVALPDS